MGCLNVYHSFRKSVSIFLTHCSSVLFVCYITYSEGGLFSPLSFAPFLSCWLHQAVTQPFVYGHP